MSQGIFLFNHKYELADTIETEKLTENYMDAVLNGLITGGFTTTEYKDFDNFDYFGVKEDNNFWLFKIRSVVKDNDLIRVSGIHIIFDELQGVVIRDKRPQNRRANEVLNIILEDTDWKAGTVVVSASFSGNFYYQSTLSALYELTSKSTCEFRPVIKFNDGKIISKEIDLYDKLSEDYGKSFAYGDNLISVVAETNTDELFTAFIGRGKGEEIHDKNGASTGCYGRKIKFDTIDYKNTKDGISVHSPIGQDYIEIAQATKMYGYPNGKPRMTEVSFDNIEDRKELADATFDYALENCRPKIQLKASGLQYENVELGEVVTIIGKLDIRYKTRVFKIKKDFLREKIVSFEFGDKLIKSMSDRIKQGQITEKEREITEQNYIKAMIEMVESSYFNEDGYQYDLKAGNEYGLPAGIYSFNKPIDQNPTKVIYLGAGKLMIANSKKSDGSWNFSVAIDGDAVNANVIRAGLLRGGRVEWDLQNGTFLIGKDKEDFSFYWDGATLKLRNVDLDLKNNYEFKQIKTDIDKSIAGVNTDLKTYVDDKDKLIDSKINSVSQSLTVAEGKLNSSISAVRTETYKDINGVKTDLANNYDTKTQVDTKIKNADSSVRTYISKNYSSITQTDEKIQSQVGSVKTEINNNLSNNYDTKSQVDAKIKSADTSVRSYVEKNYSTITQTDSKIASKVSSTKKEIMTDVNSSIGSVKSNLANNYDTKSQVDAKIKNADTSVRTYISNNYSTTTQTDNKIASKVASEIKVVNDRIDSKDSSLRTYVSNNYSTKTQTSNLIESKIATVNSDVSGLKSRMSSAESSIRQTSSEISTKVSKNGVISAINQSSESIKIQARKIDLTGDVSLKGDFVSESGGTKTSITKGEISFKRTSGKTLTSTIGLKAVGTDSYMTSWTHEYDSAMAISSADEGIVIDGKAYMKSSTPYIIFDRNNNVESLHPDDIRGGMYVNARVRYYDYTNYVKQAAFDDGIYVTGEIAAPYGSLWLGDWKIRDQGGKLTFFNEKNATYGALYDSSRGCTLGSWELKMADSGPGSILTLKTITGSRHVMKIDSGKGQTDFRGLLTSDSFITGRSFPTEIHIGDWVIKADSDGDLSFKNSRTGSWYCMRQTLSGYKGL